MQIERNNIYLGDCRELYRQVFLAIPKSKNKANGIYILQNGQERPF